MMKTLIDLLNETDVGKYLFADKNVNIDKKVDNKFQSAFDEFNKIEEPNTADENRLLNTIYEYFKNNTHNTEIYNAFKELLQLKSKFPNILDPLHATKKDNKITNNKVYRCISLSIESFNKLIGIDDYDKFYDACINDADKYSDYIKLTNIKNKIYKEDNLFLSFATNWSGAESMAYYRIAQIPSYERPVIIFECYYSQLSDKSVLNPDFSEALNPFGNEQEFIYLDTIYTFNNVYLYL